MTNTTRAEIMASAKTHFADKGFYGASIANIVNDLGRSKQALLHYFPSKEKLYGAVLQEISEAITLEMDHALAAPAPPREQLEAAFVAIYTASVRDSQNTRILYREMLDSEQRAARAQNWYLRNFLQRLIDLVKQLPKATTLSDDQALAFLYPILGSINYIVASRSVLTEMFGSHSYDTVQHNYLNVLKLQLDALEGSLR